MQHPHVPTVREIMTKRLVTLRPEQPAHEAAAVLLSHSISGAPVVDGEGHLVGLISEHECLRAVASADYEMDAHDSIEAIGELMRTELHTVAPDMELFALVQEFVSLGVRRFPVLENDRLIGQVSRRDALGAALVLRAALVKIRHHYPDYPEGRAPIRNYPRK